MSHVELVSTNGIVHTLDVSWTFQRDHACLSQHKIWWWFVANHHQTLLPVAEVSALQENDVLCT